MHNLLLLHFLLIQVAIFAALDVGEIHCSACGLVQTRVVARSLNVALDEHWQSERSSTATTGEIAVDCLKKGSVIRSYEISAPRMYSAASSLVFITHESQAM